MTMFKYSKILIAILCLTLCNDILGQSRINFRDPEITKSFTVEEIKQSYFDYYKKHGCDNNDKINKRFFRWLQMSAPYIDENGYYSGKSSLAKVISNSKKPVQTLSTTSNWSEIPFTELSKGGSGNGRTSCMTVDPNNANIIYSVSANGGVWKSIDHGLNWTLINADLPVIGVSAIAIDPNNSNVIYIGTGDAWKLETPADGVYKSTDGGTSWNKITNLSLVSWKKESYTVININPNNSNKIIVGTGENGYLVSNDAGATWSNTYQDESITDMHFMPGSSLDVVSGNQYKGAYYSSDGGTTFLPATMANLPTSSIRRIELAVTPANPNIVYALIANGSGYHGIWKSVDKGKNYSLIKDGSPYLLSSSSSTNSGQSYIHCSLEVSELNEDVLFVGGINLWKSTNGGVDWSNLNPEYTFKGTSNSVHVDYCELNYENNNLYASNDGGLYYSSNDGSSWNYISTGINSHMVWAMNNSPTDKNLIAFGLQDNGPMVKRDASSTFIPGSSIGGDGMDCLIDSRNPNTIYAAPQGGTYSRSDDQGDTYTEVFSTTISGESAPFLSSIFQDPINPSRILIPHQNVWLTTNDGNSWTKTGDIIPGGYSGRIETMEISKKNPNVMIVRLLDWSKSGKERYPVYITQNAGVNWTRVNEYASLGSQHRVSSFAFDPTDESIVYALYQGDYDSNPTEVKVLFKSTDYGVTWQNITNGLAAGVVHRDLFITNDHDIFVASDAGIFLHDVSTNSWVSFMDNLPNLPIMELEYLENLKLLRAATYGRGIWETTYPDGATPCNVPTNITNNNLSNSIQLTWEHADAGAFAIKYKIEGTTTWSVVNVGNVKTHTINNLIENSNYDIQLGKICNQDTAFVYASTATSCENISDLSINITGENAAVSWSHSSLNTFTVKHRVKGSTTWITSVVNSKSATLSSLEDGKEYDVRIETPCLSPAIKDTVIFIPASSYCDVDNMLLDIQFTISNVVIGSDISNASNSLSRTYYDFTGMTVDSYQGGNLPIQVDVSNLFSNGDIALIKCWIDYNQNYAFESAELVMTETNSNSVNSTINIPLTAKLGNTRIRIMTVPAASTSLGACENLGFLKGQYVDYTLNVNTVTSVNSVSDNNNIRIYPNPVHEDLFIDLSKEMEINVEIVDVNGKLIKSEVINKSSHIDVKNLTKGVYMVNLKSGKSTSVVRFIKL